MSENKLSRVKLYKSGKKWVAALLVSGSIASMGVVGSQLNPQVNADSPQVTQKANASTGQKVASSQNKGVNLDAFSNAHGKAQGIIDENADHSGSVQYTPASINNLKQSLTQANQIQNGEGGASQAGVDKATSVIQKALSGLKKTNASGSQSASSDFQSVEGQAENILNKSADQYTSGSINNLRQALKEAKAGLNSQEGSSPAGIKRATSTVQSALSGLQKKDTSTHKTYQVSASNGDQFSASLGNIQVGEPFTHNGVGYFVTSISGNQIKAQVAGSSGTINTNHREWSVAVSTGHNFNHWLDGVPQVGQTFKVGNVTYHIRRVDIKNNMIYVTENNNPDNAPQPATSTAPQAPANTSPKASQPQVSQNSSSQAPKASSQNKPAVSQNKPAVSQSQPASSQSSKSLPKTAAKDQAQNAGIIGLSVLGAGSLGLGAYFTKKRKHNS